MSDPVYGDDGVALGEPVVVRARELKAGHYVHRRFPGGADAGWFEVTAVAYQRLRRRYYVRISRPDSLANRLADHYHLSPTGSETIRRPAH
jgi:hypothetical protein